MIVLAYGKIRNDNWAKNGHPRLTLRAARRAMNLSIPELAKRAHWSTSYVGEIEKGTCNMSVECARSLAKVLMVSNWWELCERFSYENKNGQSRFVGDNGTIIVVED